MELIDLVNSVVILISNDLTHMVNFPLGSLIVTLKSPALLGLFLSSEASVCSTKTSPPLGNSDHVVVSFSIGFPSNSKQDVLFH